MSDPPAKDRRIAAVRLMALVCLAMGLMCVGLAWAWTQQREETACWRAAAEFQLQPEGDCRSSMWAKTEPGIEAPPARP
jgi:hypothetical protein